MTFCSIHLREIGKDELENYTFKITATPPRDQVTKEVYGYHTTLTDSSQYNMAAISQTTISNAFCEWKYLYID